MSFMRDLPCRKVSGIGRVLERELKAVGVENCGDVYGQRKFLGHLFGEKAYEFLIHCYLGLGRTNVQPAEEYERKSVGTESTFHDMSDPEQLRNKLRWTAEELEKDMRRAECKGRTLVLKVKLHTYEVYTRQTVVPKAIWLAEDLYNYAIPILVRLEQERPGMKLRLMGLRCTHLVSTKKPDTLAFFGLKPRSAVSSEPGRVLRKVAQVDEDGWEKIPEELLEQDDIDVDAETDPPDTEGGMAYAKHGKEVVPNSTFRHKSTPPPEEWWDCPICSRPQTADERQFNDHIDACLSRQAIRDAVQKDAMGHQAPTSRGATPEPKRPKLSSEKKRGRPSSAADPKQKKLCFG